MEEFYKYIRKIDDAISEAVYHIENNDNVYEWLCEEHPDWDEDMRKEFLILEYLNDYYKD